MLTGLLMKNGGGFEIAIFRQVELNFVVPANFKGFFHWANVKFHQAPFSRVCYTVGVTDVYRINPASSIEHGGTRTFLLWQRWPSRMHIYCSIGPPECIFMTSLALKNAYLWLSWPSLIRGYQDLG